AILFRSAFEELVRIENSTGAPSESNSAASPPDPLFQEKPASRKSARALSIERAGCGIAPFNQSLLPGVTGPQSATPRPWYTSLTIASRSTAAETARRNFTLLNHFCFRTASADAFAPGSFRLKTRK